MLLAAITLITALTISSVAIYYSVAGLAAIFSAAVIPIIVMGGALEVGKLVAAVWLHRHWSKAKWWLKTYLVSAVCVLMMITSMGIFGFLSKAHVEQTAEARQNQQKIEQIEGEIDRQEELISTKKDQIENLKGQSSEQNQRLSKKIEQERKEIQETRKQYESEIKEQRKLINEREEQNQERINNLQSRISSIEKDLNKLQSLLDEQNYDEAQAMVGTKVDNDYGPKTADAVEEYRNSKRSQIEELRAKIEDIRTNDPVIKEARNTIDELKKEKRKSIDNSEDLIDSLEQKQFSSNSSQETQKRIDQIRTEITKANKKIEELTQKKYSFQDKYRKFEAEVGPIKYIAEFIYGEESDRSSLEDAVRWVIVMIIFVFDPLAVLLLISSQEAVRMSREEKKNKNDNSNLGPSVAGGDQPVNPEPSEGARFNTVENHSDCGLKFSKTEEPSYQEEQNEAQNEKQDPNDFVVTVDENSEYNNLTNSNNYIEIENNYSNFLFENYQKNTEEQEDLALQYNLDNKSSVVQVEEQLDPQEIAKHYVKETQKPEKTEPETSESDANEVIVEEDSVKKDIGHSEKRKLTEKELDELDENEHWDKAKKLWKKDNPDDTIKHQKSLYLRGYIDELPWESYLPKGHEDIVSKKKMNSENKRQKAAEGYIQNEEQNKNSIWARIHNV